MLCDLQCMGSLRKFPLPLNFMVACLGFPLLFSLAGWAQTTVAAVDSPATFSIDHNHPQVAMIDGLWRFQPGDDLRWANPQFDDSHWSLLSSTEPWDMQGYHGLDGYGWYRLKVTVPDGSKSTDLLLTTMISGYQIFIDGNLAGSAGAAAPSRDPLFAAETAVFHLPAVHPGPHTFSIAIRIWAYKPIADWLGAGPQHSGSAVGDPALLTQLLHGYQDNRNLSFMDEYSSGLISLIVGLTILALFIFHPADREYFWFSAVLLSDALTVALHLTMNMDGLPFPLWRFLDLVAESFGMIAALTFFLIVLKVRRTLLWWSAVIAAALAPLAPLMFYFQWTSIGNSFVFSTACMLPAYIWTITALTLCAPSRKMSRLGCFSRPQHLRMASTSLQSWAELDGSSLESPGSKT